MTAVTLPRVVRSEWIKLRTLRSTVLTLALAAGSMGLLALVGATNSAHDYLHGTAGERAGVDPAQSLLSGWFLAQVIVAIVGVLAVSSEYASGSIAATLTAAPRRTPVLAAKLLVVPAVALVTMLVATVVAFLAGRMLLPGELSVALDDAGVPRAIVGVGVAMAAVGAIGAALGFLVRSTAGAIGIVVVVLLVLPGLVAGVSHGLYSWLPSGVLESLVTIDRTRNDMPLLAWPAALLVLGGYAGAAIGGALVVLHRRDA